MKKLSLSKRICLTALTLVLSLCTCLSVYFAAGFNSGITASAAVGERITPLELMSVHQVDWVIGPLATKAESGPNSGKYVDSAGNVVLDGENHETNNIYKIPASQYFDVEAYIYAPENDDVLPGTEGKNGRTLRGWNNGIERNIPNVQGYEILENGKINGTDTIGIYVDDKTTPSMNKYMLIVPDDITQIGTGSGAFDGATTPNANDMGTATGDYAEFTDFAFYTYSGDGVYSKFINAHSKYWSPRERLAGVYFNSSSNLKSVNNGKDPTPASAGRRLNVPGKSAFAGCNNMKFFVLPNNSKLTTIGDYAFSKGEQLRDFNIPSSVTSIGTNAFSDCANIVHLSISEKVTTVGSNAFARMLNLADVENHSAAVSASSFYVNGDAALTSKLLNIYDSDNGSSQLFVIGNDENDTGANGYYFCKNVRGYDGTLATFTSGTANYLKDNWYVVALAGKDDTTATVVRRFPEQVAPDDARRSKILYDYLDSDGIMRKNTLSETIKEYAIGNAMANNTWCSNAVLPACVDIIGDNAFHYSHTQYLEMSATKVGKDAFSDNYAEINGSQENYYIHKAITNYGSNVFGGGASTSAVTRRFIFENKTLYDTYVNSSGFKASVFSSNTMKNERLYQIPVYANVNSENDEQFAPIAGSDMSTVFSYDSDYQKTVTTKKGDNQILVSKRLSNNSDLTAVKQPNGTWSTASRYNLTLSNMTSTVWYSNSGCTTSAMFNGGITLTLSGGEINVYTKNLSPTVVDKGWVFDEDMENPDNADTNSFINLLGLNADDYEVGFKSFTSPWQVTNISTVGYVNAAGTYTLEITLKANKWGVWKESKSAQATVAQMEIDLGLLANIPTFYASTAGNTSQLLSAKLYEHIDGWDMSSKGALGTVDVVNSYIGYTGSNVNIIPMAVNASNEPIDWSLYDITANSSSQTNGLNSDRYSAVYRFMVKNSNYKFIYDGDQSGFNERRMGFTAGSMLERSAEFSKQWYITKSSNWLIIKDSQNTDPYKLATKIDGSGEEIYSWEYEFAGYEVNVPALANGELTLQVTISLDGKPLLERAANITADRPLSYYINPSMPAGEYEIVISAGEVTVNDTLYPAFNTIYTITVTPKALDETTAKAIISELTGANTSKGKQFESAYAENKDGEAIMYLHGDMSSLLGALNAKLNVNLSGTNFWTQEAQAGYFGNAELKYNRDELRNSTYYTENDFSGYSAAPKAVGSYLVYYSISAPNYVTIGGEDDGARRNYCFTTVIYRELDAEAISAEINEHTYTYSGSTVYATVPYSQYYSYSFDGTDYVNARARTAANAPAVTLTISDTLLNRWAETKAEGIDINDNKATITYTIAQAENSWLSTPQVPGWSYLGFDKSVYTITGTLKFTGAEVYYRIGTLNNGSYDWVDMGGTLAVNSEVVSSYFTVDSKGIVTEQTVIDTLNSLPVGTYYLDSYVNATSDGNVKAYDTPTGYYSRIILTKAFNSWKTTPSLTSWMYSGFSSGSNFKAGVSTYTDGDVKIVYTVNQNYTLTFNDDGSLTDAAVEYLNGLDVGSYTLEAVYAGTNNLNELEYTTTFAVIKAANSWTTNPTITPWQYFRFSAETNFIAGVPTYSTANNVVYKVGDKILAYTYTDSTFTLSEEAVTYLNRLGAGTYTLNVTVAGTDNYYGLTENLTFTVNQATTNSWKTLPAISGWTYGGYNQTLLTAGEADFGIVYYIVQSVDANGNVGSAVTSELLFADIQTALANLNAGSYNLYVVSKGATDNDFVAATHNIRFTVAKAENSWTAYPSIEGWKYGGTVNSYTQGEAAVNTGTITYTYYKANQVNGDWVTTGGAISAADLSKQTPGTYALVATAPDAANYKELTWTVIFTISAGDNGWHSDDNVSADSEITWYYGYETNQEIVVKAAHNDENKTILVNNKEIKGDLQEYLESCNVGTYTISVSVPATTDYGALEKTFTLVIEKSNENGWATDSNGNEIKLAINSRWKWDDITKTTGGWSEYIGLVTPMPKNGNTVNITVTQGTTEVITATLTYINNVVNPSDVDALKAKLYALNVGTYSIVASIPESANYERYAQTALTFTIDKADNAWVDGGTPYISGWDYSGSTAYPESNPKYGNANDVKYSYAPVIEGDNDCDKVNQVTVWSAKLPIDAGTYYIRGELAGSANYNGIIGYGKFAIKAGTNDWVDVPGVIPWNWNNYNRELNQFSGSARNEATVKFSITKWNSGTSNYVGLGVSDFSVYNGTALTEAQIALLNNFTFETVDGALTKQIPANVAEVLNALKPGRYYLTAVAEAKNNYDEKRGRFSFEVGKANNEWTTAPNVLSYGYGGFAEDGDFVTFTAGVSKYGTAVYQIVGNNDTPVVSAGFTAEQVSNGLTAAQIETQLRILGAGNYKLNAWVVEGDTYKEFYNKTAPYSVLFNVFSVDNSWDTSPETSISQYYDELHKDGFDFDNWFPEPAANDGAEITYTLLKTDQTTAWRGEYKYNELYEAILNLGPGEYIIHMVTKASDNHPSLVADTLMIINRHTNAYTLPSGVSGQWKKDGDVYKTTIDEIALTAEYGVDDVKYTFNNVTYDSYELLVKAINDNKVNAGTYQLTITLATTNSYEGFSGTVQLVIKQDKNEWTNDWNIESSLENSSVSAETNGIVWTWNTAINWLNARPKYGTQVYVDIRKKGASDSFSYTGVDYEDEAAAASAIENICKALSALDADEYTITVTSPADVNWEQISDSIGFTISKASNNWRTDNRPALKDATVVNGVLTYVYGKIAVNPQARAIHGETRYVYYAEGSEKPLTGTPVSAGKYTVEFIVDETDNYYGVKDSIDFVIAKDRDTSFVVSNGTVGWTWGDYDRKTHVFTGIPTTGGKVSYSILDSNKNAILEDILLYAADGKHYEDFDKDTYVSLDMAEKIGALKAGTYYLQINIVETTNYEGFSAESQFVISPAQNYWEVTPKITPWSLGSWNVDKNLPIASSHFGTPHVVITSDSNGEIFFKGDYNKETEGYDNLTNRLGRALAGKYTMTVTVDYSWNEYNNILREKVPLEIYKRGSIDEKNYWYETPRIDSWEANVENKVSLPDGTPLRGYAYFEFYASKRDENNQIVIDWDNPITENWVSPIAADWGGSATDGADSILIKKDCRYEHENYLYYQDFYMPTAPGYYYMVACAVSLDDSGNVIEVDTLRDIQSPIQFQIRYRENSFNDDPRIGTLLFLGERDSWEAPTAEALLEDSDIEFTYKNAETGEDLGNTMPTQPGRYVLTARANARYCLPQVKSVEFKVELSTNEWVDLPAIEDWSEEFDANNPFASALVGTENIVYTYENLLTGEITDEKPTEEGTYKLIATVHVDGYKDLVGTATFTVGPAFDIDLIIVDIILGLVAAALTIWVIVVVIKKYRR